MRVITLKTLQQVVIHVEVEDDTTVKQLKDKVEQIKGEAFKAENQKLIYAGKILDDVKLVSDYKIDEKKFVVVMIIKPKIVPKAPEPAKPVASTSAATATESMDTSEPIEEKKEQPKEESKPDAAGAEAGAPATASATTPDTTTTTASAGAEPCASAGNTLVSGEIYERTIAEMMNMGFTRAHCVRAMRASFNSPDRAVEYLLSGIPDMPEPPTQAPRGETPPSASSSSTESTGTESPIEEPLAFLRSQPQFQQMRHVIQQNPSLLPAFLQQIGQTNPQLLSIIGEYQDRFVEMLNETQGLQAAAGDDGNPTAGSTLDDESGYIHVTEEEKHSIDRLKALGFPESMCIQVYFACEKNEDLAANFLLSQDFDDEDA